jgi:hypothetical protein
MVFGSEQLPTQLEGTPSLMLRFEQFPGAEVKQRKPVERARDKQILTAETVLEDP